MAPHTAPGCENGRRQQNNNNHKTEETSLGRRESSAFWAVIDVGSGEARFAGMTALGHWHS